MTCAFSPGNLNEASKLSTQIGQLFSSRRDVSCCEITARGFEADPTLWVRSSAFVLYAGVPDKPARTAIPGMKEDVVDEILLKDDILGIR